MPFPNCQARSNGSKLPGVNLVTTRRSLELASKYALRHGSQETDRAEIKVDGVFDIETENWDTFVCGGLLTRNGYREVWWQNETDLLDSIIERKGQTIWGHNCGRFDSLWLLGLLLDLGISPIAIGLAGQSVCRLSFLGVTIRDSARLLPMSLEKASKIGRVGKVETKLPCICNQKCGGYCSIRRDGMPKRQKKALSEYLKKDCEALLSTLDTVVDYAQSNDLDLCGTVGMSAWKNAARMLKLQPANWSQCTREYSFAREGYYGGRTQVFRPRAKAGFRYDVCSAYPAALSTVPLPVGTRSFSSGKRAIQRWENGEAGIYKLGMSVPRMFIPPLPVRGKGRIGYPTGLIHGTWTRNEIERALECGAQIQSIESSLTWNASRVVFSEFCARIFGLRESVGGSTSPMGTWLKYYANSLTGKLAQNPEIETVLIDPDPNKVRLCPADFDCGGGLLHGVTEKCCPHRCVGSCGNYTPIDIHGRIWKCKGWQIADCAYIEWAAYLTAHARVQLHKQLTDDGQEGRTAVYCDTDSCFSTVERTWNIGSYLGNWKMEGRFTNFESLAPKTYHYFDPGKRKWIARAKGIPNADKNWHLLRSGRIVEINRGVMTFRTAARDSKRMFRRKHMHRQLKVKGNFFGDRTLGKDKLTYPPDAQEFLKRRM